MQVLFIGTLMHALIIKRASFIFDIKNIFNAPFHIRYELK